MMTTTGIFRYSVVKQDDGRDYVPPTFGETSYMGSLGDFGDLDNFTQNEDTDNVDQLSANDAEGTLVQLQFHSMVQDTSSFDFASNSN